MSIRVKLGRNGGGDKKVRTFVSTQHMLSFSLIEILVVVAIISILASMLLPALQKAREKVRQIKCISNLRQVGMAMMLYCQDYNGFFLAPNPETGVTWSMVLDNGGYLKYADVLLCPSWEPYVYSGVSRTYGMRYLGIVIGDSTPMQLSAIQKIASPSEILFLADSVSLRSGATFYGYQVYRLAPTAGSGAGYHVHLRHSGMANCLFFDGHVKSLGNVSEMGWQSSSTDDFETRTRDFE